MPVVSVPPVFRGGVAVWDAGFGAAVATAAAAAVGTAVDGDVVVDASPAGAVVGPAEPGRNRWPMRRPPARRLPLPISTCLEFTPMCDPHDTPLTCDPCRLCTPYHTAPSCIRTQ